MKEGIKTANPYLGEKIEQTETIVKTTVSEFESKGFCSNYKDFNIELFRPFKRADNDLPVMSQIVGTLSLKPENPKMAFVMWNVLCFWLGVIDFVVLFLISDSLVAAALVVAAADGFAGYCFAYLFYFVFICSGKKQWMLVGFVFIALYVCITLYLCYANAVTLDILELLLNVLKTASNTIIGYHAYVLFKDTPSGPEML